MISINFPNQSTTTELRTVKKVGQGKFSVYQVYSPSDKTSYALKAFPKNAIGTTQFEKEKIMFNLSHPNIIKSFPATTSDNTNFHAILTEFTKFGDFFELVVGGVVNSEIIIRTYFHQLVAGLEYLHSQEIAHLDLKLENLMLTSDFSLKIIDFDQAQRIGEKKLTSGGTRGFRAPEMIDGVCKNFCAADVYAAGVVLYAFRAQEYPFGEVVVEVNGKKTVNLKNYTTFMRDNKKFWETKATLKNDTSIFSDDFKEIINGMLEYNVEKRFSLEDIKKSKWYNGPVLDGEQLKSEMKNRYAKYQSEMKQAH